MRLNKWMIKILISILEMLLMWAKVWEIMDKFKFKLTAFIAR